MSRVQCAWGMCGRYFTQRPGTQQRFCKQRCAVAASAACRRGRVLALVEVEPGPTMPRVPRSPPATAWLPELAPRLRAAPIGSVWLPLLHPVVA